MKTAETWFLVSVEWAEPATQLSVEWAGSVITQISADRGGACHLQVSVEWAEPATCQPAALCLPPQQRQATPQRWQALSGA